MKLTPILVICLFQLAILLMQQTDVDAGGPKKSKGKQAAEPKPRKQYTDAQKEAMKAKTPEEKDKVKANRVAKKAARKEQCVVIIYSKYFVEYKCLNIE